LATIINFTATTTAIKTKDTNLKSLGYIEIMWN
jgi:hypothetical protein